MRQVFAVARISSVSFKACSAEVFEDKIRNVASSSMKAKESGNIRANLVSRAAARKDEVKPAPVAKMADPSRSVRIPCTDTLVDLKYLSLLLLVAQNVCLVLSIRYSRIHQMEDGAYVSSTAVVVSEFLKLVASLVLEYFFETGPKESFTAKMKDEFFNIDTVKLSVPGLLYTFQNNMLFVALTNLTAATYQVTAQLKILTTAVFSVIMLGKQISMQQTLSLFMLTIGVGVVQVAVQQASAKPVQQNTEEMNQMVGLAAVLSACLTSGFAGVYFEKILKRGRKVSIYIRNVQLGFFGVVIGLITVAANDLDKVMEGGFFQGYGVPVMIPILTQAVGGLLVAVVMKYADNILKGFATSLSIVLASILSAFLFEVPITNLFMGGAALVIFAVYVYGKFPPKPSADASKGTYSAVPTAVPEGKTTELSKV
ncbi:CMP-sialic acid transporter [Hondaea fermentalgiana]|uniref:CMP-sialic acid transporter n=1 Tax=Hondaea fermentalgiana TaxID=2315210 RepID=A0A2R5GRY2_9STRA|nr:CMP-sialic acid transporter [Hondaea fermentalgiana]|eukprot:GBG32518.1 CMP-sialic acid transporter [Hondaea fermentalgiana]